MIFQQKRAKGFLVCSGVFVFPLEKQRETEAARQQGKCIDWSQSMKRQLFFTIMAEKYLQFNIARETKHNIFLCILQVKK